jgi:hypothetical protein
MEKEEACDGTTRRSIQPQDVSRRAFYPLTLPLTVGPGSISVAITPRRERGAQSRPLSSACSCCAHRFRVDRAQHFSALWICRPLGTNAGTNRYVGHRKAIVVSSRLHRRANWLERGQSFAGIRCPAYCLTPRCHPFTGNIFHRLEVRNLRRSNSYANCALSSSRQLNCENSATRVSVSRPAMVAASISVVGRIDVATSALHSQQYLSLFPGSSNNSVRRPQTLHRKRDCSSLPFGPLNIEAPPWPRSAACNSQNTMLGKRPFKSSELSLKNS